MVVKAGDIVEFSGARIKIDRVFDRTVTQVQIFGRFVDEKGNCLPGSARKGNAAGWFRITDLKLIP